MSNVILITEDSENRKELEAFPILGLYQSYFVFTENINHPLNFYGLMDFTILYRTIIQCIIH